MPGSFRALPFPLPLVDGYHYYSLVEMGKPRLEKWKKLVQDHTVGEGQSQNLNSNLSRFKTSTGLLSWPGNQAF